MTRRERRGGPIAWTARHGVAANLLMLFLIFGGLLMASRITQEVFPSFELDTVTVTVALPGATPEEVEQSVVLSVEDALGDIEGIDKLSSQASEGVGIVTAELDPETDRQLAYNEIRQAVDRIDTFPEDAEAPQVSVSAREFRVLEVQIHGPVAEHALRMAAERVRAALLLDPGIARVEISKPRDLEIHVEIAQGVLRAHALTLPEVAARIRAAAQDRGAGTVESPGGDVLIRLADRRDRLDEFAAIPIVTDRAGTVVRLGDIATLSRGFADTQRFTTYAGNPAIQIDVLRTGAETPVGVSEAVRWVLPEVMRTLPEAIDVAITDDDSEVFQGRMDLLLKNGFLGLLLVLLVLSLFLEFKLAFWVAMGIPTAFLGTFLFLDPAGASINMVTMFAFILALGIVVDDAIVVGENIYEYMQNGMNRLDAAIEGARDIAVPLAFSILTNIVAFLPLALVPGMLGKFFVWIPAVVAAAFLLSWIEALFVLPGHLANIRTRDPGRAPNRAMRVQRRFAAGLDFAIHRVYAPLLRVALGWRYATVAAMLGGSAIVMAVPVSGQMGFSLFPPVPRDYASAAVTLPVGTPLATAEAVRDRLTRAAEAVIAEHGGAQLGRGVYARIDSNEVVARAYLQPPETRPITTAEFQRHWRAAVGPVPEARSLRYSASFGGPGSQSSIEVELSHPDAALLAEAAARLATDLEGFGAVRDPDDGFTPGKQQLEFRLTEAGRALGLSSEEVGRQVRAAFFGVEALAQQEGRNEVSVRVRLPREARRSLHAVETLLIRTPEGGEVPLYQIATVEPSRAEAVIRRIDGRRTVTVTANVVPDSDSPQIVAALSDTLLPELARDYPGLDHRFGGRQEATRETTDSFTRVSIPLTLALIYVLLAIPFRSYAQPFLVLAAIPFGVVGAVLGHMLMGMSLSMISVFGVIALSGVVINAGIVMIDYANRLRRDGLDPFEAIWRAGVRRFRPILLTTLTTFFGLAPMIFETSAQARFLIPMAVSLGYGILFATLIVMLFIPALYLVFEDVRRLANPVPRPLRGVPGT